jgi:hypothetical protein
MAIVKVDDGGSRPETDETTAPPWGARRHPGTWSDRVRPLPAWDYLGRATTCGVARTAAWYSFPSVPKRLEPQHIATPAVVIAQLCLAPTEIELAVNPTTVVGATTMWDGSTPSPTSPNSLPPQHLTAPRAMPQVWFAPELIAV